jgi:hypothetical protein
MLKAVELLMYAGVYDRVAMPYADGRDSAEEIKILVPISIPDVLVLCICHHKRVTEIVKNGGEEIFFPREAELFSRHGSTFSEMKSDPC